MTNKTNKTRTMIIVAMLGALAAALMFFEISVPFSPAFIKFDFSDLPVLISAFLFGPVAGVVTALVKILLKLIIKPTSTAFVGELANFLLCACFVVVASIVYRQNKTKKQAIIGLIIATIATSLAATVMNYAIMFPFYAKMFGMPMDAIIQMVAAVNPLVKDLFSVMLFSILPFNIFKYGVISIVTVLIYKRISVILRRYTQ